MGKIRGADAAAYPDVITDGSAVIGMPAEAVGTGILVWAMVGMAVNPKAETPFAPLVIGLSLGVAAIIFANATSAWLIVGPVLAALGYRALVLAGAA